jgi:hypothetical protein
MKKKWLQITDERDEVNKMWAALKSTIVDFA